MKLSFLHVVRIGVPLALLGVSLYTMCTPGFGQPAVKTKATLELDYLFESVAIPQRERIEALLDLLTDTRSAHESRLLIPEGEETIGELARDTILSKYRTRAIPAITSRFQNETDPVAFEELVGFLYWIGEDDAQLKIALQNRGRDQNPIIRKYVLYGLALVGSCDMRTDELMMQALEDENFEVVIAAVKYAKDYQGNLSPTATPILRRILREHKPRDGSRGPENSSIDALYALANVGVRSNSLVNELEDHMFNDVDENMRIAAAFAHSRLTNTNRGHDLLIELATDKTINYPFRNDALRALVSSGRLNNDDSAKLLKLLENEPGKLEADLLEAVVAGLRTPGEKLRIIEKYVNSDVWFTRDTARHLMEDLKEKHLSNQHEGSESKMVPYPHCGAHVLFYCPPSGNQSDKLRARQMQRQKHGKDRRWLWNRRIRLRRCHTNLIRK